MILRAEYCFYDFVFKALALVLPASPLAALMNYFACGASALLLLLPTRIHRTQLKIQMLNLLPAAPPKCRGCFSSYRTDPPSRFLEVFDLNLACLLVHSPTRRLPGPHSLLCGLFPNVVYYLSSRLCAQRSSLQEETSACRQCVASTFTLLITASDDIFPVARQIGSKPPSQRSVYSAVQSCILAKKKKKKVNYLSLTCCCPFCFCSVTNGGRTR